MSPTPVEKQPSEHSHMLQEKQAHSNEHSSCESQCSHHSSCHKRRTRRAVMLAISSFLMLALLLLMTMSDFGGPEMGLFRRQNNGTGTGQESVFVKNKCAYLTDFSILYFLILRIHINSIFNRSTCWIASLCHTSRHVECVVL